MNFFITDSAYQELLKIEKVPSHSDLRMELYKFLSKKRTIDEFKAGKRVLEGPGQNPFIKVRVGGSGKFRMHYLLFIKDNKLYISHLHPKRGRKERENLNTPERKIALREAIAASEGFTWYEVILNSEKQTCDFKLFTKSKNVL